MSRHAGRWLLLLTALSASASPARAQAAGQTGGQAATQQADSTKPALRPGLGNWTTDRRDFRVGDVVTLLVDAQTIALAQKSNVDQAGRSTTGSLGANLPSGTQKNVDFRTSLDNSSNVKGQADRRDGLTTELSARVVSVEPGGLLKIEGTRTLKLDKAVQKVTITGWVRAQDISARNIVESWRLANAELAYESKGDLGKPKQGIFARILGMLWP